MSNDCLSWIVHSCQCCLLSRIMSSLTCFACRKNFCPARIVSAWSFLDCSSQSCPPKIVSSLSLLQSLQLLGRFWIVAIRAASQDCLVIARKAPFVVQSVATNTAASSGSVVTRIDDCSRLGRHYYSKATRGYRPLLPLGRCPLPHALSRSLIS